MLARVDALPLSVDSLSDRATNMVGHGVPHVKSPALCDLSIWVQFVSCVVFSFSFVSKNLLISFHWLIQGCCLICVYV